MTQIDIILENTRLANEYASLPMTGNSEEEYKPIQERRNAIIKRVEELRTEESKWINEQSKFIKKDA